MALDEHSIVAITDIKGRITYVNDTFCEISEYSRGELIGQDHRIINSGFHPEPFFLDLWCTISSGKIWKGDVRNRAKSGKYYWVQTTIVPFRDVEGKVCQYLAVRTDITEKIFISENLAKTNRRLSELTEKLKAERLALNRKNIVLNELIAHVERERDQVRQDIRRRLETIVGPLLDQVRSQLQGVQRKYLDLIRKSLDEISEPILKTSRSINERLTPKELQICNMIKNGMSVKEIAKLLNLSPRTVDKHRENIRKKLGLTSRKINLTSHLLGQLDTNGVSENAGQRLSSD